MYNLVRRALFTVVGCPHRVIRQQRHTYVSWRSRERTSKTDAEEYFVCFFTQKVFSLLHNIPIEPLMSHGLL